MPDFGGLNEINSSIACVMMEPVQGEGGIILPEHGSHDPEIDDGNSLYPYFQMWEWNESANALGIDPKDMTWEEFVNHRRLSSIEEVKKHMKGQ